MITFLYNRNISKQLFAGFIVIMVLTVAVIGLLSIWLLQNQLDQQAWSQVEQGQRAASALHSAQYREILNLATMIGQRPTLRKLLTEGDIPSLTEYLHIIKDGAGLTRILVCDQQNHIIATTDDSVPETICTKWLTGNYQYNPTIPQACLTAHQPIQDEAGTIFGEVFVCNQLDDVFASQISQATGLEHTIWIDDVPVSTSFNFSAAELLKYPHTIIIQEGRSSHHTFEIDDHLYYSAHIPLEEAGLGAEVALDVSEIRNTGGWLTRTYTIIIIGGAFLGSVLGILIIRSKRGNNVQKHKEAV
jgi:hypothetical protein